MYEKIFLLLAGAAVGWLFQQYRIARSEEVALLNEHIKDVEKFIEAAQAYWLTQPETLEKDKALAAKVRAAHMATTLLYPNIEQICGRRSTLYRHLSIHLFDEATGMNFEGADRKLDPERAIQTHVAGANLIHQLRLSRTDVVSLRRLGTTVRRLGRPLFRIFSEGKSNIS